MVTCIHLHVHVIDTFLAVNNVNVGYYSLTLTPQQCDGVSELWDDEAWPGSWVPFSASQTILLCGPWEAFRPQEYAC